MKIADGIYAYIWRGYFENNCNSFYFGEPFNMLFDPGLKHHVDTLMEKMKKDGIDTENISYVVNTHSHPDHIEGSACFTGKIPVVMHEAEIDFYAETGQLFFEMMGMDFPDIRFDIALKDGTWNVAGSELEVYRIPGHSPGLMGIYWKEKKALVCGDLIFEESFGRYDFPGGDVRHLKESIMRMSELDVEYLLPGHMNALSGKKNVQRNFADVLRFFNSVV